MWLRRMIRHIQQMCGLNTVQTPTIIYEDNAACVAQVQLGYVKSNLTKHINPKFFYAHELQKMNEARILHTKSCDNLVDLFTKSLPASSFERCIRGISMIRLREMPLRGRFFTPLSVNLDLDDRVLNLMLSGLYSISLMRSFLIFSR